MIEAQSVLGVIPARGGSKGVPGKNIRLIGGKPLIAWTIEEARKSQHLDRLILSSDDEEIMRVAREWGLEVPFRRPAELAHDDTPGIEPVLHALQELPGYDYVVQLQPTSPLRTAQDIDETLARCVAAGAPACVSLTRCAENPAWMFQMNGKGELKPVLPDYAWCVRRQQLPVFYRLNGAVYVARTEWIQVTRSFIGKETVGFEMPAERSLDIDSESDFQALLGARGLANVQK